MDAGFQVDIDFNTESKFSCSRSSFFSTLSGPSKPAKPIKLLSCFIHLGDLEGLPNHPVSKARAFRVKCKQTWQLLVKIESDPFVNK